MWWIAIAAAADLEVGLGPSSWPDLATALANAAPGDRILLGPGQHEAPGSVTVDLTLMGVGPAQTSLVRTSAGAALRVVGSSVVVRDLTIDAADNGRALWVEGSGDVVLERSRVTQGTSTNGASALISGSATLRGVEVDHGVATDPGSGGCIRIAGSATFDAAGLRVHDCSTPGSGGGLSILAGSNATLSGVEITDSTAGVGGGALYATTELTVDHLRVVNTQAAEGGAVWAGAPMTLTDVVVDGSTATGSGGAFATTGPDSR
ncbi:MAG: right-handed parallel beta-helix repeat-containing protein [Myxococcales bacterium]|nr:right-handed parallel beta-helix repeat-containing protein [Myxococcales bacterium]